MLAPRGGGRVAAKAMIALALVAGVAGCGSSAPAATVNGSTVTNAAFHAELTDIRRNTAALSQLEQQGQITGNAFDGFSASFVDQILGDDIEAVLVGDAVRARHLVPPIAAATALSDAGGRGFERYPASYRKVLIRRTADRVVLAAALSGVTLTPAVIDGYYRSHSSEFTDYCLSGLALDSQAAATAVQARLAGGADLAATARAQSVDPTTASDGGVFGCGGLGVFPALDPVITTLPVGRYSAPVAVGQVWYVVKVTKRNVQPLPTATPTIVGDLIPHYGPFNSFLDKALSSAHVTVDPRYGSFDRSLNPPAVVPG